MHRSAPIAAVVTLVLCTLAPPAMSATIIKQYFNHAVSACQPALPVFDGLIRKRPKALANEGNSNAFVTCAPNTQLDTVRTVQRFGVFLANRSGSTVTFSCTLVDGFYETVFSNNNVKSFTAFPGVSVTLSWFPVADNGNNAYSAPAVSCVLPPGTEIAGIFYQANDEIGN